MITSGRYSGRAGRRVAVSRGEVQIAGVDSLFKVKGRVVFLQGVHADNLRCCRVTATSLPPQLPNEKQPSADCLHVTVVHAGAVPACVPCVQRSTISTCVHKCGRRICAGFQWSEDYSEDKTMVFVPVLVSPAEVT